MVMKKLSLYILALAALSGCMTIASEETPSDRIGEMTYYAKSKVAREVRGPIQYLAMAVRLDEYTNLSEQDRKASKWSDIRGKVFVNEAGDIDLNGCGEYKTGHKRFGEAGTEWVLNLQYGFLGITKITFVCAAPATWVCTAEVPGGGDNALKAVLRDKDKGIWGLEYSSSEKDGVNTAVFSSTGLEADYLARYPLLNGYADSPVALKGIVRVDFFQSGEKTDWVELSWSGTDNPAVKTSRD